MTPWHAQREFTLYRGDSVVLLKKLPANSQDSFVTDPPYGIRFMGKAWDGANIAKEFSQNAQTCGSKISISESAGRYDRRNAAQHAFQRWTEAWAREAWRVLKPGGYLLCFASTRTYHRMAAGVEDAGFEIRDQIAWTFGSGFPKSLDVSKAIDASDKIGTVRKRSLRFTEFMRSTGITSREINEATNSSMASHYLTRKEQPEIATEEMFAKLRPVIARLGHLIPADVEQLVAWRTVESENMKRRKVVRVESMVDLSTSKPVSLAAQGVAAAGKRDVAITAAHTEDAKTWEGWGTALKPAWEPIVVARKPLDGTVADNVLEHGTGALNIDACRIAVAPGEDLAIERADRAPIDTAGAGWGFKSVSRGDEGRFPANLCHDGSPEVLAQFPADLAPGHWPAARGAGGVSTNGHAGQSGLPEQFGGDGSAARFFYCAKSSTEDRDEGLEAFEDAGKRANIHPTVKPTELMRWLTRLVTRPGGKVCDPFTGSGSTGKACMLEGFEFTGIDLCEEGLYLPIAKARILYALEHKDRWEAIHAQPTPPADTPGQLGLALAP